MGAMQRRKGASGEREFANAVSEALGVDCRRTGQFQSSFSGKVPDIDWDGCEWWFECKRGKKVNYRAALAQAIEDSESHGGGRIPVVLARDDREEAVVVMRLTDWLKAIARTD